MIIFRFEIDLSCIYLILSLCIQKYIVHVKSYIFLNYASRKEKSLLLCSCNDPLCDSSCSVDVWCSSFGKSESTHDEYFGVCRVVSV